MNFKQAADPRSNLARFGISPTYSLDFGRRRQEQTDYPQLLVLPARRPNILHSLVNVGAAVIVDALRILLSNPAVWEKTALDRQTTMRTARLDTSCRRTPPPGTPDMNSSRSPGYRLGARLAAFRGPIGLGSRPCLVISPYSRAAH